MVKALADRLAEAFAEYLHREIREKGGAYGGFALYNAEDGLDDPDGTDRRVVRGGSWRDRPKRSTASYRLGYEKYQRLFNVGFRIVMTE